MSDDPVALFGGMARKPKGETQLTREIADLCSSDEKLRLGFAKALLASARTRRAESIRSRLPASGAELRVDAKDDIGQLGRKLWRKIGGKPDLIIEGPGLLIVVEVKIEADFQPDQLVRYMNHPRLGRSAATRGGVILLNNRYYDVGRTVSTRPRWLGQTTWRELIPELKRIHAADADLDRRWQRLWSVVEKPGDLGDGVSVWNRGNMAVGKRNRLILESIEGHVSHHVAALLNERLTGTTKAHCTTKVAQSKDSGQLTLVLKNHPKTPAVTIEVSGTRRPLTVSVTHRRPRSTTRGRAANDSVVSALEAAKFKCTEDVVIRSDRFGPKADNETPPEALERKLDPILTALVQAGALDHLADTIPGRAAKVFKNVGDSVRKFSSGN